MSNRNIIFAAILLMKERIILMAVSAFLLFSCGSGVEKPEKENDVPLTGFNQNWSMMPSMSDSLLECVARLRPEMLRYPGGTVAHSWNWREGRKSGSKNGTVHKIGEIAKLHQRTGAGFVFVLDIVNGTVEDQIQMLDSIAGLGVPVKYIELGNEVYAKEKAYIAVFPTGKEYAERCNVWIGELKKEFPDCKISVVLQCRGTNLADERLNSWNRLVTANINGADAFTYHLYISVGKSCDERVKIFEDVVKRDGTDESDIWITEYGNQNDSSSVDYCDELLKLKRYLESSSAVIVLNHQLFGGGKSKFSYPGFQYTEEGLLFKP